MNETISPESNDSQKNWEHALTGTPIDERQKLFTEPIDPSTLPNLGGSIESALQENTTGVDAIKKFLNRRGPTPTS